LGKCDKCVNLRISWRSGGGISISTYACRLGHKPSEGCQDYKELKAPRVCNRCRWLQVHRERRYGELVTRLHCVRGHNRTGSCDKFELWGADDSGA